MKIGRVVFLALLTVTLHVAYTVAEDKPEAIKALQPEVQTAKWAVKWWQPRHEQKLADKKQQGQVDLLMIGDSITHGWEGSGKPVWEEYYSKRKAFNIGFSGDRTEQVLWRIDHGEVDEIAPRLAVIMIGTNNTGHRQDAPEHTAAGIQAIVERLRKKLPQTKVLLLAIFPRGAKPTDKLRQINDAINQRISKLADDKHVFYLDINDTFLEDDGTLPKSIMPDLLHPNRKGYEMWAQAMEGKISQLMGE